MREIVHLEEYLFQYDDFTQSIEGIQLNAGLFRSIAGKDI